MLRITVPAQTLYDEQKEEFIDLPEYTLELEHSLVSISKWESKWTKAFLSKREKTYEETIDYIKCMTLTPDVDDEVYSRLSRANVEKINKYIEAPMTASYMSEEDSKSSGNETVTSELIYYWMISLNIPVEFQNWHLNRLLTLVKVCNRKNNPPKPMGQQALMNRNRSLNAARRKQFNTHG